MTERVIEEIDKRIADLVEANALCAWRAPEHARNKGEIFCLETVRQMVGQEIARARENHKGVMETKRTTDARLKAALEGLQAIYTLCAVRPANADPMAIVNAIYQISGDAFEKATHENSRA